MNNGLYQAYFGLRARQLALDAIAHNLANASSDGYKADQSFFRALRAASDDPLAPPKEPVSRSSVEVSTGVNFGAGVIRQTGRELDLALEGDGFIAVQTPAGRRYTRNGSLSLNAAGQLVTHEGHLVLGLKNANNPGPITLPPGQLEINPQGRVSVDGVEQAQLRLVTFSNFNTLQKEGGSLFAQTDPNAKEQPAGGLQVHQGALETSNVNSMGEMVTMLKMSREFETLQRSVVMQTNDIGRIIAQEIGKL